MTQKKVAIIGGGVAGLVSAYLLSKVHDITLFEANDYIGGHTNTITIDNGPDKGLAVDTGFIVCTTQNYPNFCKLLSQLNVPLQDSDMSFSYHQHYPNPFYYSSDFPKGIFAQYRHIVSPYYWRFLADIFAFNKQAIDDLNHHKIGQLSLVDYLQQYRYSQDFLNYYILPMGAAIWSASFEEIKQFPAQTFIQFWANHGLLQVSGRPRWKTVKGGSRTYVTAILNTLQGRYHTSCPITSVHRTEQGICITDFQSQSHHFDAVVIATHADQAYRLLADPSTQETALLSPWKYSKNDTYLHTDTALMPPSKKIWASWNYLNNSTDKNQPPIFLSYYMNRLQNLTTSTDYFVTLNPPFPVNLQKIIKKFVYTHPIYSFDSLNTQAHLPTLNGVQNTYFCGSYFGYGFHEDAVKSAVAVATQLGVTW
jgi:predicted NAD/FAD-binding protein